MFASLVGKVSVAALRGTQKQYSFKGGPLGEFHGHLRSTMGYPYSHDFSLRGNNPLRITDFDQHWWLQSPVISSELKVAVSMADALKRIHRVYEEEDSWHRKKIMLEQVPALPAVETIHDPVRVQGRGRPFGSTVRVPSEFEHVASALAVNSNAEKVTHRRYGVCRGSGHNARSCRIRARPLGIDITGECSKVKIEDMQ